MIAEVKYEKVIIRKEPFFKIKSLTGFAKSDELPNSYFEKFPRMVDITSLFDSEVTVRIYTHNQELSSFAVIDDSGMFIFDVMVGLIYEPPLFGLIMSEMKKCGKNLAEINRKLAWKNKNWHGEGVIKI